MKESTPANKRFSHYRILQKLGAGGMGEVYLAEDAQLDRKVAIKLLPPESTEDQQAKKRLVREARAAAKLDHPNICSIYEVSEEDGRSFIVMQYVEGETLASKLQQKPLELSECLEIAARVADALSEAHSRGIIHRDIKPGNIMLTAHHQVKVMDFGMAKVIEQQQATGSQALTESLLTEPGMVMGTVPYMSPEQVRGETLDARSDIFSFGAVLYEMLSGRQPFSAESAAATISAILIRDLPPLARYSREVPAEMERIVAKALRKNREERYQTAKDLFIDLKTLRHRLEFEAELGRSQSPDSRGGAAETTFERPKTSDSGAVKKTERKSQAKTGARSKAIDSLAVGRDLNVRAIVSGRVLQLGDILVLGVELVSVADGSQLWGEQYKRKLSDVFAMQEEIATEISGKLRLRLTREQKKRLTKRHTENAEAYQLYLKGRYFWNQRSDESLHKGIAYFEEAIRIDPAYALAYTGLADCYTKLGDVGVTAMTPREAFARGNAAAIRALEIDSSLAEAHASLGHLDMHHFRWADAEKDFRRAIEQNPNYATAHQWYAYYMAFHHRFDEALERIAIAGKLDPLSLPIADSVGEFLYFARRHDEAIEQFEKTLDMDPDFLATRINLGRAYEQKGMFKEAEQQFIRARQIAGESIDALASLGHTYALSGKTGAALEVLAQLGHLSEHTYVSPYDIAIMHAGLGDLDEAFSWLDQAYRECAEWMIFTDVDPRLDPLRSDPRFTDLITRLGFAAPSSR